MKVKRNILLLHYACRLGKVNIVKFLFSFDLVLKEISNKHDHGGFTTLNYVFINEKLLDESSEIVENLNQF